ncbi:MAG: hypothetical protein LBR60_02860, partial [Fibrobacter sp.]|nr:hypothetical protein [Fibrobacter sp.]
MKGLGMVYRVCKSGSNETGFKGFSDKFSGWKPLRFGNQVAAHIENTFYAGANCIDAQKVLELRGSCILHFQGVCICR